MKSLRIATRGSRLALAQVDIVAGALEAVRPGIDVEPVIVKTTGDRDARPFAAIGGKGLFVTEVERAIVERRADVALHSAKDLTAHLAEGCSLICVPARGPVEDVVIGGEGADGDEALDSLPPGSSVGTSSIRRRSLLSENHPDLVPTELRGNIDTRVAKLGSGEVASAILAAAGLDRIGLRVAQAPLNPAIWVPAPGQGALAVEALTEREDLAELFSSITDSSTYDEVVCERAFSLRLEGGCTVPLGCLAVARGQWIDAHGYLGLPEGGAIRERATGPRREAAEVGVRLAEAVLSHGGDRIVDSLRAASTP